MNYLDLQMLFCVLSIIILFFVIVVQCYYTVQYMYISTYKIFPMQSLRGILQCTFSSAFTDASSQTVNGRHRWIPNILKYPEAPIH